MCIDELLQNDAAPIIAILRGIEPDQAVAVGEALVRAGVRCIEVPLNSPQPLESIGRLRAAVDEKVLIGAGTVLTPAEVDAVAAAGARFMVAPNTDAAVIARALERGLDALPGFFTASEGFAAVAAGARHLKLFPAVSAGPKHLAALRDVLPREVRFWAVGGIDDGNLAEWLARGAAGVGVGGSVFRPGMTAQQSGERARELVAVWRGIRSRQLK
jgi:2-dehydro-3-deoxyphosphogalactonate aldolase